MATSRQHSASAKTWVTETFGFHAFALAATAGLALALWLTWASAAGGAVDACSATTVTGRVISCGTDVLAPPCTVEFTALSGQHMQQSLGRTNIVGVMERQDLSLWLGDDGTVAVAGWRLWVDVGLLLLLAVAMSAWSVQRLAALLRHGDPREALPLRDLSPFAPPRPPTTAKRSERAKRGRKN